MPSYYEIMYDNGYERGQTIGDYVMGLIPTTVAWKGVKEYEDKVFDLTVFWDGEPFHGKIPDFVKLIIEREQEDEEQPDLLPNPVSWLIFSERLVEYIYPLIKKDVQIFDPPIYRESDDSRVEGYKLINPIHTIDCLDYEKTKITRGEDGTINFCSNIHIKERCVGDHHIFRIKGYFPPIIISEMLAKKICEKYCKGFAFLKLGVTK